MKEESSIKTYPLAIKMMFNYDAESNAMSILRAMSRETVPSRCIQHSSSRIDQQWLIGYVYLFVQFGSYIYPITYVTYILKIND